MEMDKRFDTLLEISNKLSKMETLIDIFIKHLQRID